MHQNPRLQDVCISDIVSHLEVKKIQIRFLKGYLQAALSSHFSVLFMFLCIFCWLAAPISRLINLLIIQSIL